MKFFRKLIIGFGIFFVVLIALLIASFIVVKRLKIKEIVENQIEHNLGINVSIGSISFSPLLVHIRVDNVVVHNPPGFVTDELAYINSLRFVTDPLEILILKRPNIYLCALDVARIDIIKNKQNKVNIKELIPVSQPEEHKADTIPFYFDVFVLSIGTVKYTDYSGPVKKEYKYPVGLEDAAFVNLKDSNAVVRTVIFKALEKTDIGQLINLSIVPVFSEISNTVGSAWGTAKTGAKSVWQIVTLPIKLVFDKN